MHVIDGLSALFSLSVPLWLALIAIGVALSVKIALFSRTAPKPHAARTLRIIAPLPDTPEARRAKPGSRSPFHRSDNKVQPIPDTTVLAGLRKLEDVPPAGPATADGRSTHRALMGKL